MKYLFLTALLCLIVLVGFTQPLNSNEQQIINLENKWMRAMLQKDSMALNQIMEPHFKLEGIQDLERTVGRATWMTNTLHHLDVDSIHFMQIKVDVNHDAAIARASFFWKGAYDKEPFTDSVYLVDVWIKKNNRWQVVSRMLLDK